MASDALDPHQNGESAISSASSQFNHVPTTSATLISTSTSAALNMSDNTITVANLSTLIQTQKDYEELTSVFYTTYINDTRFEILKRYDKLKMIGSGAQGVVW